MAIELAFDDIREVPSLPPYTHEKHASRCLEAANDRVVLVQFVQAKKQSAVICCKILGAWTTPDGLDLWKLEELSFGLGVQHLPVKQTRQCSGLDGRCACAGETSQDPASGCAAGLGESGWTDETTMWK